MAKLVHPLLSQIQRRRALAACAPSSPFAGADAPAGSAAPAAVAAGSAAPSAKSNNKKSSKK